MASCHLAGGSLDGLEASIGVAAELFAQTEYSFNDGFALVSGAILFDYRHTSLGVITSELAWDAILQVVTNP